MGRRFPFSAFVLVFACPALAMAKDPPPLSGAGSTVEQASSGTTEIDGQGAFQSAAAPVEGDDATEITVSGGGILSTGNSNQAAMTTAFNLRIRRDAHQFGSVLLGNYGASKVEADAPFETTVKNVQGRVRYDYFFAKRWSAFGMLTARHDPFQQLDLRLNVDPGVAFYVLPGPKHRFWMELGYDFQYDRRTLEGYAVVDEEGEFLDEQGRVVDKLSDAALNQDEKTATNHALRSFVGYSNHLSDSMTFDAGIEYLQSVILLRTLRLNFDAGLTAAVNQNFSIATTLTLRYDNNPLAGVEKLDTVSAVNLSYRFK